MKMVNSPSTKPAPRQLRRRNTLTPGEFAVQLVFFGLLAMLWYRSMAFRCLSGRTAAQSKAILWLALGASLVLLGALSWRERRNDLSLAGNVLLPFGLYTAAAYWDLFPRPIVFLTACAAALCLVHGGVMLRLGRGVPLLSRLRGILLGWRTIAALCLSVLLVPAFIRNTLGYAMFQPPLSSVSTKPVYADDLPGTLLLFQDEVLAGLDLQQRLDALQELCAVERTNLGLPHELIVEAGPLPAEGNLARYNDSLHRITFDLEHLLTASGEELLDTLAHECYHAYQFRLVDAWRQLPEAYRNLQPFQMAESYDREMQHYQRGDDFFAYYDQDLEADAREYAAGAVERYMMAMAFAKARQTG